MLGVIVVPWDNRVKATEADRYEGTYRAILDRVAADNLVHADETKVATSAEDTRLNHTRHRSHRSREVTAGVDGTSPQQKRREEEILAPMVVQSVPASSTRKALVLPRILRYLAVPHSRVKLLKVLNREEV
jgi:hypothetical protein